ncbi:hypothetical protein ANN_21068 [Periplaneta americana]|uniref:DUF4817 domain-containing protein n=1 Tax=Periplaneta americana TaxID=6978 RepID=A0ABQ8SEC9_PERAM|nr:hypothetical protein ANN_21068 [Periplaneta americana]
MAGLCEGGNEPPGSLKASNIAARHVNNNNNNNKMEPRLSFEQRKAILKWYWRTENVVEVQRQWRREYRTEPPTRLTIARIRDKFETHGTVCDVYKGRSGRPRTSTKEKDDHIKNSFYEELEHTFDQFPRYHMEILLGDFNAKVGREDIFRPTIGKESLHAISSDNGVRLVNFATSKNLIVKSTTFPHKDIHKYTWTSPDGLTHNQIDHILIDKRRHTSIVDIRTFRGADCNSDHYLVIGELRERLSVAKRVEQQVNITKFNILKLKDEEAKQNYQVEISNRFATLESSDEVEKELDVNSVWENIRDSIKIAAEQSIGYYETKKKKPWFDEDCCMVVERRKQAKLKFLQDPVEEKRDNYFNERREASRTLRNKERLLEGKTE